MDFQSISKLRHCTYSDLELERCPKLVNWEFFVFSFLVLDRGLATVPHCRIAVVSLLLQSNHLSTPSQIRDVRCWSQAITPGSQVIRRNRWKRSKAAAGVSWNLKQLQIYVGYQYRGGIPPVTAHVVGSSGDEKAIVVCNVPGVVIIHGTVVTHGNKL